MADQSTPQQPDAAQERTAGEASTSGGAVPSTSSSSKDKPFVVLIIGELCRQAAAAAASPGLCQREATCSLVCLWLMNQVSSNLCDWLSTAQQHTPGEQQSTSRLCAAASQPAAGMAGSGKTTLIQRINSHMHQHKLPGYIINLDPAVTHLPYGANIDIRDTVRVRRCC
jgi:hypothetical protein